MTEVPIPFVEEDVDTSEPSSALMSIALLIAGFGLFAMASDIGGYVGTRINQGIGTVLGFNPATGEDSGDNGVDIV
jgi:hypothetical protein